MKEHCVVSIKEDVGRSLMCKKKETAMLLSTVCTSLKIMLCVQCTIFSSWVNKIIEYLILPMVTLGTMCFSCGQWNVNRNDMKLF
jgi:hypothetical protein